VELFHFVNTDVIEDINKTSLKEHASLMKIKRETIINPIIECNLSKNIANFRGTFDLIFKPTKNWKKAIRPGDWVVIYLGIDGNEVPRMLGNVDRVSRVVSVNDKGIKTILYKISGSNFGKVLDKYNVFWNPYILDVKAEQLLIHRESVRFIGRPDEVVKDWIDVFLGYGRKRKDNETYEELNQWFIPNELTEIFSAEKGSSSLGAKFYDILNLDLARTEGKRSWSNIGSMEGTLSDLIRRSSNSMINEIFLEIEKNPNDPNSFSPTMKMRMIPFAQKNYDFGTNIDETHATRFLEIDGVKITTSDILAEDLGESDHTKFNLFFLGSQLPNISGRALVAGSSDGAEPRYPRPVKGSIRRNGLVVKWQTTEYTLLSDTGKDDDFKLLKDWNNLLFHWYNKDFKYETGSMVIVGNPEIKLGKRLEIEDNALGENRNYYIEGYTDTWAYPNRWMTTLQLTRGQDTDENPIFESQAKHTDEIGITSVVEGFHKSKKKDNK